MSGPKTSTATNSIVTATTPISGITGSKAIKSSSSHSGSSSSKSAKPTLLSVGDPDEDAKQGALAEQWPCASCAALLGAVHLAAGCMLLVFDVATNERTGAMFGVSSALAYILCALMAFIAARRIDRVAQCLLMAFASVAVGLSAGLFVENAWAVNGGVRDVRTVSSHSFLLCLALMQCEAEISKVNTRSKSICIFSRRLVCDCYSVLPIAAQGLRTT